MSSGVFLELLGYLASALIALSPTMRSIVRLRWVNLAGSLCFAAYGILIGRWPSSTSRSC